MKETKGIFGQLLGDIGCFLFGHFAFDKQRKCLYCDKPVEKWSHFKEDEKSETNHREVERPVNDAGAVPGDFRDTDWNAAD